MSGVFVPFVLWLLVGAFNIFYYKKDVPKLQYVCMYIALIMTYIVRLT